MNITCSRSELHDALRIVSGVVDPRNIKPILKDVRIRTVNDTIEISATDLEVGIKYFVRDVEINEQGGIVVPGDPMNGIVSESTEERLSLSVKDSVLVVEGSSSRFQVNGVAEEDFPEIPDFPDGPCINIEGAILREMIERTIFAVAIEKQRYALNGILFVTEERSSRIVMVGTDGRRLALIRRKANEASPVSKSAIIPVKALQQVQKMIGVDEIVSVNLQERRVMIKAAHSVLVAQLVEGRFPPYEEVIPDDCDKRLEIDRNDFANAVRQAAVLSARESRSVLFRLEPTKLILESSDAEAGDAHVELSVKYEGSPVDIHFNPDYLLDGLKVFDEEIIRLEMKDASQAAVMRSGSDYVYLLMPITQD